MDKKLKVVKVNYCPYCEKLIKVNSTEHINCNIAWLNGKAEGIKLGKDIMNWTQHKYKKGGN